MNIKIKITNAITGEVTTDNTVTVNDYSFEVANANHEYMSKTLGDCFVNFSMDNGDFICGMPYGMKQDQKILDAGLMTWEEYCNKWYKGDLAGCNED